MPTATKRKRGRQKRAHQTTLDTVVRDSLGRFAEGGCPGSGAKKGSIQQKRVDELMFKVTKLQEQIDAKQGDPMKYLEHAITSLAPLETVLEAVGVCKQTRFDWLNEIEEGTSERVPYLQEFFNLLERQRADALIDVMLKLKEIGMTNPRSWYSLCWLLERTHQNQFVIKRDKAPSTAVQVNVDISAKDALSEAEVRAAAYRQKQLPAAEHGMDEHVD